MKDIYPQISRIKKLGSMTHRTLFKKAHDMVDKVNILNTRLDFLQFIRTFGGQTRELWR